MFRRVWYYLQPFFRPREWLKLRGRPLRLSTEGMITLTFVVLLLIVTLWAVVRIYRDQDLAGYFYILVAVLAIAVLIPAIAVVTYVTLRLLFEEPYEMFDDIQRDWQSGLEELRRRGLDLRQIPLYLVLGGESNDQVHRLFKASGIDFAIMQHPAGRSALYWYANQEAIYITCNEVGSLSHLERRAADRLLESRLVVSPQGPLPGVDLAATCWPTDDAPEESLAPRPERAAPVSPLEGTMQVSDEMIDLIGQQPGKPIQVGHEQLERETARLEYLCRLILAERTPFAPINGMLTLLPVNVILGDASEGNTIKDAVRADLRTTVHLFGLRFPTIALVNGWEDDPGFQELVRRLPPRSLVDHRFGKGARIGHLPTPDYLEAICHHVCKAFEDFIYHLFKQPESLKKTNNRLLYDLLCKVRRYLRPRLIRIVSEGYDCGDKQESLHATALFAGCYVVASGRDAARQAFVPKVFERLFEFEKPATSRLYLEWLPATLRADGVRRRIAHATYGASLILLVVAVVFWFFFRGPQ